MCSFAWAQSERDMLQINIYRFYIYVSIDNFYAKIRKYRKIWIVLSVCFASIS